MCKTGLSYSKVLMLHSTTAGRGERAEGRGQRGEGRGKRGSSSWQIQTPAPTCWSDVGRPSRFCCSSYISFPTADWAPLSRSPTEMDASISCVFIFGSSTNTLSHHLSCTFSRLICKVIQRSWECNTLLKGIVQC